MGVRKGLVLLLLILNFVVAPAVAWLIARKIDPSASLLRAFAFQLPFLIPLALGFVLFPRKIVVFLKWVCLKVPDAPSEISGFIERVARQVNLKVNRVYVRPSAPILSDAAAPHGAGAVIVSLPAWEVLSRQEREYAVVRALLEGEEPKRSLTRWVGYAVEFVGMFLTAISWTWMLPMWCLLALAVGTSSGFLHYRRPYINTITSRSIERDRAALSYLHDLQVALGYLEKMKMLQPIEKRSEHLARIKALDQAFSYAAPAT